MAKDFADISRLTEAAEMNASTKRDSVAKMMKAWESKNARRALQGAGLSTMAITLAACGGSSTTSTTTTTTTTPTAQTFALTAGTNTFTGGAAADTFNAGLTDAGLQTLQALDVLNGGGGTDTINISLAGAAATTTMPNMTAI